MKPIIKWQTHTTEATAKVLGVELSVKSNSKGKFESTVYCSGIRPEKDHTLDTLDDGKAWCEQTLQRWINASFDSVITQTTDAVERTMTLIEKLEQARDNHNYYLETCGNDRDKAYHSFGKKCYQEAIEIVKQHSDWVSVSELKLTEDDYGKDFIAYECEYFKTTGRATYQDGGYWRFDCARGYCASANISHVIPIPKFQPPSEVQDD